ncbi:spore germination protein GerPE [Paenibacillus sp. J5C_2022]|uniref:spore germination protein GerPE n=1 Tax=Paenibacillus sp. J5C2022 TaxID=2977129 RepID=UPI0021D0C194|nr:spore germination protein GerPE [Paenibacillus sp. J5C2022]MCU6707705.1 spore germination protein GerPE [Paenibacillus sp. J5C2022]
MSEYCPCPQYAVRTAKIGAVCIISAATASVVQFGDRGDTYALLRALAVQRAENHITAGEAYFEAYSIFNRPLPYMIDLLYDTGQLIQTERINHCPDIRVGFVRVTAMGSSSSFLAGNARSNNATSKIKHIRQYPSHNASGKSLPGQ